MSPTSAPSVLVVEDEESLAEMYAAQLRDEYDVEVVTDGRAGLEAVTPDIDVVLLDRRMGGTSGDEVLSSMRARDLYQPVAMVTAVPPDFEVVDLTVDDYLLKPVSADRLRAVVARLLDADSYDSLHRRLSSLRVRRNVLRAEKSAAAIEESDAFADLEERIDEIEARLAARRAERGPSPPPAEGDSTTCD